MGHTRRKGASHAQSSLWAIPGGKEPRMRPKTIPVGHIYYQNFTAVHPNGTMDAELAAAIAKL